MRLLLAGDGEWAAACLQPLIQAGHEFAAVSLRNHPSDKSLELTARALNLPILRPENINAESYIDEIKSMKIDLGVSIACDQIMRRPLLDTAKRGFINFHAGKLPSYRGRNIINWAIINGESEIGVTAHVVNEGIDTGDIVLQRTLPVGWTDTYGDVLKRIVDAFPNIVVEAVSLLDDDGFLATPQRGMGTYFCGREDGDEWIEWSDTSLDLHNKIRGISRPGPGARTLLDNQTVTIWHASYDPAWPKYRATPGQVVGRNQNGVIVKTGDSTIELNEVQIADGPCEKPKWKIGTRLGIDLYRLATSLSKRITELEQKLTSGDSHV